MSTKVRWFGTAVLATTLGCTRAQRELPHPALATSGPAPAAVAPEPAPVALHVTMDVAAPAAADASVDVKLTGLVPEGARWWITIVEPEQPDTAWGRWQWVEPGTTSVALPSPGVGRFEVRLHARHPDREADVVARATTVIKEGL